MEGKLNFGKELRLFREWSKFIGFAGSVKVFNSAGISLPVKVAVIFSGIMVFICAAVLSGCNGLTFAEKTTGELKICFSREQETKSVVRDFPDSNVFILSIKSSSGNTVYSGAYGEKPGTIELEAGSYDISIVSRIFVTPEFDAPCYSDSKTIVIQAGKTLVLSLVCRQSNVGLRLLFSQDFIARFSGYIPEVSDIKGTLVYPYTEERFAYLNAGNVQVLLKEVLPEGSSGTPEIIPILNRVMASKDMLTVNLHANPDDDSGDTPALVIDTTANWVFEYVVIGGGGDGLTKESAFNVDQLVSNIGTTGAWVTGYIVGGDLSSSAISFEAPFASATNLAIADSPTIRDRSKCASVSIPSGSIREWLNLSANPQNLGRKIYLKGTITASYFGITGINPLNAAEF
jgi:hypothetical protein